MELMWYMYRKTLASPWTNQYLRDQRCGHSYIPSSGNKWSSWYLSEAIRQPSCDKAPVMMPYLLKFTRKLHELLLSFCDKGIWNRQCCGSYRGISLLCIARLPLNRVILYLKNDHISESDIRVYRWLGVCCPSASREMSRTVSGPVHHILQHNKSKRSTMLAVKGGGRSWPNWDVLLDLSSLSDGMMARVFDGGVTFPDFPTNNGVKQGCVQVSTLAIQ